MADPLNSGAPTFRAVPWYRQAHILENGRHAPVTSRLAGCPRVLRGGGDSTTLFPEAVAAPAQLRQRSSLPAELELSPAGYGFALPMTWQKSGRGSRRH